MPELSYEQKVIFDAAMESQNIFISGPGGVGKSFVLTEIIGEFKNRNRRFRVAASTGVAALNIGGCTIHSLLSTDIKGCVDDVKQYLGTQRFRKAHDRLNWVDTIIVDEVSMLSGDYIQMMDFWLRQIRGSTQPFGDVQIIFCGDFLQLPPVEKGKEPAWRFAFQCPAWQEAKFKTIDLSKSFRQEDQTFVNALNRIRYGDFSKEVRRVFRPCIGRDLNEPTHLVSTNDEASTINFNKLREHPGQEYVRKPKFSFPRRMHPERQARIRKSLVRDSLTNEPLRLKIGVPVILLKNHRESGYVNGSRGIVTAIHTFDHGEIDYIQVKLDDNGEIVSIHDETWSFINADKDVDGTMQQLPVRLAWALTIHKSQGLTLDNVEIDLSRGFACGQAYVALSRMKNLEGLALTDAISPDIVKAEEEIVEFYDAAVVARGGDVRP